MSLSYYYEFCAPASCTAEELEDFLRDVETFAKSLGFSPTTVLNVPFDTPDRREFAFRLGGGFTIQHEALKGVHLPAPGQITRHDPVSGECRLIPEHGVVLVITDELGRESCFGFFRYPAHVMGVNGREIVQTALANEWLFRSFVDSPDSRYREIVHRFAVAGFVNVVKDEFA